MKLWDLDTQHCFQTLVGHRSEVRMGVGGGDAWTHRRAVTNHACYYIGVVYRIVFE